MPKMKLSCPDRLDQVPYVTKTKQDNSVTDRTSAIYTKNNT